MSTKRTSVLVLVDWFAPGYKAGGPIRSVTNLVDALDADFDFSILTSNQDYGDPEPYADVPADEWVSRSESCRVWYASPEQRTYRKFRELLRETPYDVLYLNSMFSLRYTFYPIWITRAHNPEAKVILAPRGMLHAGALALKSRKKKLFLGFIRFLGIHKHITFQATDAQEAADIRRVFGDKVDIVQVPNLPKPEQPDLQAVEKRPDRLKLVFLSRLSEKKGVHYLLERLEKQTAGIDLDLYGPDEEPGYWQRCQTIIDRLPANVKVRKLPPVPPEQIPAVMATYHCFIMPTMGENFGHAIFEAMSCGRPVIISDQTPWRDLEAQQAGVDLSMEAPAAFEATIARFAGMDQATYDHWARHTWQYARNFRDQHSGIDLSRQMLKVKD